MKLPEFITFDCYGTLINFEINKVTTNILGERANKVNMKDFLIVFRDLRFYEVLGPYRPYSELLRRSLRLSMEQFDLKYTDNDGDQLVAAVPTWGPFPDVKPVIDHLRQHIKLVIISNAEDAMIAQNIRNIDVPFYDVITAEQARAYKPSSIIFNDTLRKLGCNKNDILHVAQGFNYDIVPAHGLGWERVWINRNNFQGDQATYGPYLELPDLTRLPSLLCL
jgi:2-haloacid dehalogenase